MWSFSLVVGLILIAGDLIFDLTVDIIQISRVEACCVKVEKVFWLAVGTAGSWLCI